jgi:hypothetical protein
MERTHNQPSPNSDAGPTFPPRPLSTGAIVPYQGEENVNARAAPGSTAKKFGGAW